MSKINKSQDTNVTSIKESKLGYFVVYSNKNHVRYIDNVLSDIDDTLLGRGYKQLLLGNEIKNGEYYLSKFEELVDNCVLGIIVLDGLRPNVVFELGFLKGRNKPIIVLKSQKAYINVENLYKDPGILTKIKLKI